MQHELTTITHRSAHRLPTNKMAVDGPRPAESLRHLACSLAALDPAPWEKVRLVDQWKICSMYSLDWIGLLWCGDLEFLFRIWV